jgi:signal peptidase complex subunit 2
MAEETVEVLLDPPHKIETGDSIKVKQVLDEATVDCVVAVCGYTADYKHENFKLFLMFLSCVFATTAQFFPLPFPQNRPLLGVCCFSYGLLSSILQFIITFVDKDTIMVTKSSEKFPTELCIRTSFPRFQDEFILTVQKRDYKPPVGKERDQEPKFKQRDISTVKMYVGRYFTFEGEFDEERFHYDVSQHIKKLENGTAQREYSLSVKSD